MCSPLRRQSGHKAFVCFSGPVGFNPLICAHRTRERRQIGRISARCADRDGKDGAESVINGGKCLTFWAERRHPLPVVRYFTDLSSQFLIVGNGLVQIRVPGAMIDEVQ
jgi:hypothetical protein